MASTQQHADGLQHDPYGHGSSVAAWTAVGIVVLGSLIMAIAVVVPMLWLLIVGAVVVVAGGISGKVLGALGFGPDRPGVH